jgi:hypothetical protein
VLRVTSKRWTPASGTIEIEIGTTRKKSHRNARRQADGWGMVGFLPDAPRGFARHLLARPRRRYYRCCPHRPARRRLQIIPPASKFGCDNPAFHGHQPREADVSLQREGLSADGRGGTGGEGYFGVIGDAAKLRTSLQRENRSNHVIKF